MMVPRNVSRPRNPTLALLAAGGVPVAALVVGVSLVAGGSEGTDHEETDTSLRPGESRPTQLVEEADTSLRPGESRPTQLVEEADPSEPSPLSGALASSAPAREEDSDEGPVESDLPLTSLTEADVVASLEDSFEEELEVLGGSEFSVADATVVSGPYAEALANRWAEYEASGLYQTGFPQVTSVEVLEEHPDEIPPRAVVYACIDSSRVDVLDESGNSLLNEGSPPTSAQIFTLLWQAGRWAIHDATFPDDPRC